MASQLTGIESQCYQGFHYCPLLWLFPSTQSSEWSSLPFPISASFRQNGVDGDKLVVTLGEPLISSKIFGVLCLEPKADQAAIHVAWRANEKSPTKQWLTPTGPLQGGSVQQRRELHLHPARGDASFTDLTLTGKQMETSGRGSTEAMWTHSKNSNNDNFQSFIYLRVKGQGFHWPEIPEAWLLSTTPVVLQRNPHGVLCGRSFWQRGSCFTLVMFCPHAWYTEQTWPLKTVILPPHCLWSKREDML